jgi:predicted kinase
MARLLPQVLMWAFMAHFSCIYKVYTMADDIIPVMLPVPFEEIYAHHSVRLNLEGVRQDPVLIVFSAIPGSGKSELTRRLVSDYGFLRIANKDIREAIEQCGIADGASIIGSYTLWLLDKLTRDQQPSIVFDRNIDQWHEASRDWAKAHNYRYGLVRIDVSRQILGERLMMREGDPAAKAFQMLSFYAQQHVQTAGLMAPALALVDDYDLEASAKEIASL